MTDKLNPVSSTDTSQLPEKLGNEEYFSQLERRVAARRASLQRRRDAFRARLQEAMVQDGYDEAPPSCAEMNETGLERDLGIGRATDKAEPVGWMTHAFRLRRLRRRLLQAERLQYRAQRMNQANRNALEAAEGPTKHTVVLEAWLLAAFATLGACLFLSNPSSFLAWNASARCGACEPHMRHVNRRREVSVVPFVQARHQQAISRNRFFDGIRPTHLFQNPAFRAPCGRVCTG